MRRRDAESKGQSANGNRRAEGESARRKCRPGGDRRAQGVVLVWVAIFGVVLIGLLGLSLDWGKVVWNVHELQNAGDSAALAGAQWVKYDQSLALTQAHDLAHSNYADTLQVSLQTTPQPEPFAPDPRNLSYAAAVTALDGYDILVGRWIRQWAELPPGTAGHYPFFPTCDGPDAVRTVARREGLTADAPTLPLLFGAAFGVSSVQKSRRAVAWGFRPEGSGDNALICLSQSARPGFEIWGNAYVQVPKGSIQVNSNDPHLAAKAGGNSHLDCAELNVVGETNPPASGTSWDRYMISPYSVNTGDPLKGGVQPVADPLAATTGHLPVPPKDPNGNILYGRVVDSAHPLPGISTDPADPNGYKGPIMNSCTLGPGYYPDGIDMTGGPTIVLDPDLNWDPNNGLPVYYLGGVGLLAYNGTLTSNGEGVTIYITNDPQAALTLHGNATIDIVSPADAVPGADPDGQAGIALWQDSRNKNPCTIRGTASQSIVGTWYIPSAFMDWNGTPNTGARQIIVDSMKVTGNVGVLVDYHTRNSPPRRYQSVLVE